MAGIDGTGLTEKGRRLTASQCLLVTCRRCPASAEAQVLRGRLSIAACHQLETDAGAFGKIAVASLFNCCDVNKHILPTALRRDKPVPFRRVEPLHRPHSHVRLSCSHPAVL